MIRLLIDGYNLMYAGGLLGKSLKPEQFRKARLRFLNELSAAVGPLDAVDTTVVFDASNPPFGYPARSVHKGLLVLFAVSDENADARIEHLIANHGNPKRLKVVSSDRRIRQAATRRRAFSVSADDFWAELDGLKEKQVARKKGTIEVPNTTASATSESVVHPSEAEHWAAVFADLDEMTETREALGDGSPMLTDGEIAEIEREIELEDL